MLLLFPYTFSFKLDSIRGVHHAIQNSIGNSLLANDIIPTGYCYKDASIRCPSGMEGLCIMSDQARELPFLTILYLSQQSANKHFSKNDHLEGVGYKCGLRIVPSIFFHLVTYWNR